MGGSLYSVSAPGGLRALFGLHRDQLRRLTVCDMGGTHCSSGHASCYNLIIHTHKCAFVHLLVWWGGMWSTQVPFFCWLCVFISHEWPPLAKQPGQQVCSLCSLVPPPFQTSSPCSGNLLCLESGVLIRVPGNKKEKLNLANDVEKFYCFVFGNRQLTESSWRLGTHEEKMGKTEGQIAVDNQLGHAPAVVWLGPRAPCQWARCCVSPTAKIRLSILASWEHPVDHADHQGPGARSQGQCHSCTGEQETKEGLYAVQEEGFRCWPVQKITSINFLKYLTWYTVSSLSLTLKMTLWGWHHSPCVVNGRTKHQSGSSTFPRHTGNVRTKMQTQLHLTLKSPVSPSGWFDNHNTSLPRSGQRPPSE